MNGIPVCQKLESVQDAKVPILTEKKCTKCKKIKKLEAFGFDNRAKDGRQGRCRDCTKEIKRQHRRDNLEEYRENWRIKYKISPEKHREESRLYRKNPKNRLKIRKTKMNWGKANPEKIREYRQRWRKANKERVRETARRWCKSNPEKVKERNRKSKEKLYGTSQGKLNHCMSSAVYNALSSNKNGRGWELLVGYTVIQLKKHLEKNFKHGMSWNNYGKNGWHIDHIIPQSAFNFEKPEDIDFKRCWALKNLQPMWAKENISKGDRLQKHFQPSLIFKSE